MRGAAKAIGADNGDLCRALLGDDGYQHYARARQSRAHVLAESINDVAEQVLSGEISPEQGRVALDAKKWVAARILKGLYGDAPVAAQPVCGVVVNVDWGGGRARQIDGDEDRPIPIPYTPPEEGT